MPHKPYPEQASKQQIKTLQQKLTLFENYKEAMDESCIVSKSDLKGIITYVNKNFTSVSQYTREEAVGRPHSLVRHFDTPPEIFADLWKTITSKRVWKGILKNRTKNGGYYWVDMLIKPILDETGEIVEYIAVRHDITELIDQRIALEKSAYTDTLTALPNRAKLRADLRITETPSVALLNLDGFSRTNDFYGHPFGDKVIVELARIIGLNLPAVYTLYHLNADEFLVLNRYMERERFIDDVERLIARLRKRSAVVEKTEVPLEISGAISFEPVGMLLSSADIALKLVKKSQDSLLVYDASLSIDDEYEKNLLWSRKLKAAIEQDRLQPYYQPIVDNVTLERTKYEALVRMTDETGEIISPFHFLDIAKRSKQYRAITQTVIAKSFETFKTLDMEFSINLTIDDILDPILQKYLCDKLKEYNIGERLVIELVESEGIENFEEVSGFINQVKKHGCKIAIDDFGTGYSNFEYLMRLKADYIKIDGSMIKNINNDANARIIVTTIVTFAKQMGIKTIAEFVWNEAVFESVKEAGIDYSQGYYFSEPLPRPTAE